MADRSHDDPLSRQPGYALRRAANAMMAELASRLSAINLRISDASVLLLVESGGGLTSAAIGKALDIQRPNMVPLLARLEGAGLITRAALDGKRQAIALSPAGVALMAEVHRVTDGFERDLLARIPAEHRPHLLPALTALWQ